MRFLLNLLMFFGIAMLVGFGLSYLALERGNIWGTLRIGPWVAWSEIGSPTPDPYTRAYASRTGALELSRAEGIKFVAEMDSDGNRLQRNCSYLIDGTTPQATLWTLVATQKDGTPITADNGPMAMNSTRINRAEDGSFAINVGPELAGGNWLEITGDGYFLLVLTLYDPAVFSQSDISENILPTIIEKRCDV